MYCRFGCSSSIGKLRRLAPALFTCTCQQKKESSRRKCQHIQYRITNNTCLGRKPHAPVMIVFGTIECDVLNWFVAVDVPHFLATENRNEKSFRFILDEVRNEFKNLRSQNLETYIFYVMQYDVILHDCIHMILGGDVSSCVRSFRDCVDDLQCHSFLFAIFQSCRWFPDLHSCDRQLCLESVKVQQQSLKFCESNNFLSQIFCRSFSIEWTLVS